MAETAKIYRAAIEVFGGDLQVAVAIEEMAELTKELCKAERKLFAAEMFIGDGKIDNHDEIAEEIADVQIVLEELMLLFGISSKVQKARKRKLERLEMRIEKAREERRNDFAGMHSCIESRRSEKASGAACGGDRAASRSSAEQRIAGERAEYPVPLRQKGLREMQLSNVQAYAGAGTRKKFRACWVYEAHGRRVGRAGGRNDGREDRPGQT